jgi:uncharacterized membrane protein YraQ (UPF0718 family)
VQMDCGEKLVLKEKKTRIALKKVWKSFENSLPQFLCIILITGMSLAFLDNKTISMLLGQESGIIGLGIAATVGSTAFIPAFVAYPLAASLTHQSQKDAIYEREGNGGIYTAHKPSF